MLLTNALLRIRYERKKGGWRIEDLAHFAKVSAADVSRVETGRMSPPYPAHARRLASALDLRPEELQEVVE